MRKKRLAAILAIAFLLLLTVSIAAENLKQRPLRGLKGVYVAVENMDPQAERLGLSKAQILSDVELRLRKAGIRVLTQKERLETPGYPFLYVNLSPFIMQDLPLVAYSIRVELQETVMLARGFVTPGKIWNANRLGTVGTGKIRELQGKVDNMVEEFINDYLGANPK
jgi:hypothetical protein